MPLFEQVVKVESYYGGRGKHIKEAFELAVIPILNLRHKTNISHIGVAITRPTKLQKCRPILLSSFISHKPQVAICYLNLGGRELWFMYIPFVLNLEIISPLNTDVKGKVGGLRGLAYTDPCSHRSLLTQSPAHTQLCSQDPGSHPWPSGHICIMSVFYVVASC